MRKKDFLHKFFNILRANIYVEAMMNLQKVMEFTIDKKMLSMHS